MKKHASTLIGLGTWAMALAAHAGVNASASLSLEAGLQSPATFDAMPYVSASTGATSHCPGCAAQVQDTRHLVDTSTSGQVRDFGQAQSLLSAQASYGVLQASAWSSVAAQSVAPDADLGPDYSASYASAQSKLTAFFSDSLTINGGAALNGTRGKMRFGLQLQNSLNNPQVSREVQLLVSAGASGVSENQGLSWSGDAVSGWAATPHEAATFTVGATSTPGAYTTTPYLDVDFTFGTAFNVSASLSVLMSVVSDTVGPASRGLPTQESVTAYWSGIQSVQTAAGLNVGNYSVSSVSGTNWALSQVPDTPAVPEPDALVLALAGVALLWGRATHSGRQAPAQSPR